ncbi:hypothetical protein [Actinoallomurus acaciae]|uniref:Uncharacterized protein n=1 Tax=Actinoallomurus acaciae TaxID=502577 RepID=A0ABV5YH06_9ACTN
MARLVRWAAVHGRTPGRSRRPGDAAGILAEQADDIAWRTWLGLSLVWGHPLSSTVAVFLAASVLADVHHAGVVSHRVG